MSVSVLVPGERVPESATNLDSHSFSGLASCFPTESVSKRKKVLNLARGLALFWQQASQAHAINPQSSNPLEDHGTIPSLGRGISKHGPALQVQNIWSPAPWTNDIHEGVEDPFPARCILCRLRYVDWLASHGDYPTLGPSTFFVIDPCPYFISPLLLSDCLLRFVGTSAG